MSHMKGSYPIRKSRIPYEGVISSMKGSYPARSGYAACFTGSHTWTNPVTRLWHDSETWLIHRISLDMTGTWWWRHLFAYCKNICMLYWKNISHMAKIFLILESCPMAIWAHFLASVNICIQIFVLEKYFSYWKNICMQICFQYEKYFPNTNICMQIFTLARKWAHIAMGHVGKSSYKHFCRYVYVNIYIYIYLFKHMNVHVKESMCLFYYTGVPDKGYRNQTQLHWFRSHHARIRCCDSWKR